MPKRLSLGYCLCPKGDRRTCRQACPRWGYPWPRNNCQPTPWASTLPVRLKNARGCGWNPSILECICGFLAAFFTSSMTLWSILELLYQLKIRSNGMSLDSGPVVGTDVMSMPTTLRFDFQGSSVLSDSVASHKSSIASVDEVSIRDPPWSISVSMIKSGLTD